MPLDLKRVRRELDENPLKYAGKNDTAAATLFHVKDRVRTFPVPTADILASLLEGGEFVDMEDLALKQGAFAAATDAQARSARQFLAVLVPGRLDEVDLTLPVFATALAVLVDTGALSATRRTALQDKGRETIDLAKEIGLGRYTMTAQHIERARAL